MASQHMTMRDIFVLDCQELGLIRKLQEWGALASEGPLKCAKCGITVKLSKSCQRNDGYQWRCSNKVSKNKQKAHICGATFGLRKNTFFSKSKLSLWQIVTFCYMWCHNFKLEHIVFETQMCSMTGVIWNSFCREVAIHFCISREQPIGGPNMTVEIDECIFGKSKYYRRHLVKGQWVLGGICRETGDMFLVPVESRDASTLIPLIEKWILPGSTIISDCVHTYDGIDDAIRHLRVNHSVNFKDPATGDPRNTVEGLWKYAKCRLPKYNRKKVSFVGYLAKFMFRLFCQRHNLDPIVEFFRAAGVLHNPYRATETLLEEESEDEDVGDVQQRGETVQPGRASSPQASTSAVNVEDSSDYEEDENNCEFF